MFDDILGKRVDKIKPVLGKGVARPHSVGGVDCPDGMTPKKPEQAKLGNQPDPLDPEELDLDELDDDLYGDEDDDVWASEDKDCNGCDDCDCGSGC